MKQRTPLLMVLVLILISLAVSANEVTYDWSLVRRSTNRSEWEMWYNIPPNRVFVTFDELDEKNMVTFDCGATFGWTDDSQALFFNNVDRMQSLGIRSVNRSIRYNGERLFKAVVKVDGVEGAENGVHIEVYYYDQGGVLLGKNDIIPLSGTADWKEYSGELVVPADTVSFAIGVVMGGSSGQVAFERIWMEK